MLTSCIIESIDEDGLVDATALQKYAPRLALKLLRHRKHPLSMGPQESITPGMLAKAMERVWCDIVYALDVEGAKPPLPTISWCSAYP
eukprot:1111586-Pelagomonas_calceolata.AAC.3